MIITCEQCNTAFNLDQSLLKPAGSKVRCSKCRHIFTAFPPALPAQAPASTAPPEEKAPDLSDAAGAAAAASAAEEEFDLSDLESSLDKPEEPSAEEDLDLGLDLGSEEAEPADGEDELDFSDLDFGDSEETEAEAPAPAATDEGEFDLSDLDLEEGDQEAAEAPAAADEGELDLWDLELDLGETAPEEAPEAPASGENELDLGDLDFDFGEAEEAAHTPALEGQAADEGELDLGDLELDLGGAEEDKTPEPEAAAEDELDISEFESVLDEDNEEVDAAEELDVDDLDLDFELEPIEKGEKSQAAELEVGSDDEEIDLSELELDLETEELDGVFGDDEIEDIEEIEDLDAEALEAVEPAEDRPATFAETVDMETLEREAAALEEEGAPAGPGAGAPAKPRRAKRKLGKPVLVLLLLAVLGGGGYYAIDTMGVRIPYVSDLIRPAPDNVNRIEVMQATVRSKFVENAKTGKLFVITGRVRNGYEEARNFIGVTGNLYAKGKKVQSASVFAGNALSDAQLSAMDMNAINKALRNRVGEKKSNMNVRPDQTLPFMLVFDKLPTELEEFTVEPGASTAAQ